MLTVMTISDTSKHGIGGYNSRGLAWRFELPPHLRNNLSINLLEFAAAAITIHLSIANSGPLQKVLAFTDSSSAIGWLYKASFKNCQKAHDTVARWLAESLMHNESSLYAQHIKGTHSTIADCLSRDFHLTNIQLTSTLNRLLPQQMPKNFAISPLPPDIISWIHSLPPQSTKTPESHERPHRRKLGALTNGEDTLEEWELMMRGLQDIIKNNKHNTCPHLQQTAEEIKTARQARIYLQGEPLRPPSHTFERPSG